MSDSTYNNRMEGSHQISTDPIRAAVSDPYSIVTHAYDPRWTAHQSEQWLRAIETQPPESNITITNNNTNSKYLYNDTMHELPLIDEENAIDTTDVFPHKNHIPVLDTNPDIWTPSCILV